MNEANEFYEDMRSRHQAVLSWRDGNSAPPSSAGGDENPDAADARSASQTSASVSGKGVANGNQKTGQTKDGTKSPSDPVTNSIPNG